MTLGERLRDLRVSGPAGYRKLREVASAVGCDFPRWSRIENDRERPTPDLLDRAAAVLGADPDELAALLDDWQEAPPVDLSANICHKRW